jgi:peptide/nickel transport system permease protein
MTAFRHGLIQTWRYIRRNPALGVGLVLLLLLMLFSGVGSLLIEKNSAYPLAAPVNKPPSLEYPFGTDSQGRNLLSAMIVGTPLTLRIGLIAGSIGLGVGTVLGFLAAFYGGVLDAVIRWLVDVLLTVPGLLVLVVIASTLQREMSVEGMALVVSLLAWMWPTRTIRSQVLTMRERPFVLMARLSGMSGPEIIVKELMPNLLPYLGASFVGAVTAAILASIGLEALGLGPLREPTLGMTIYWVNYYTALVRGLWWWGMAPIVIIVLLFISLFLISAGLDELANPRVRRAA